jgi:hypothetical protein
MSIWKLYHIKENQSNKGPLAWCLSSNNGKAFI